MIDDIARACRPAAGNCVTAPAIVPHDLAVSDAKRAVARRWRATVFRIGRVAVLSAAAKGPGFLIPLIAAATFGAGAETDAYFLAYGAVLLAGSAVSTALEAATVPAAARALRGPAAELTDFRRMLRRRGLAFGITSACGGGVALAIMLTIFPPANVPPAMVLRQYALLAPMALMAALSGSYSGAVLAAGKLETSIGSNFLRGLGALAGAIVGAKLHALWPLGIGPVIGEACRVSFLHRRFRRVVVAREDAAPEIDPAVDGQQGPRPRRAALSQMSAQLLLAGTVLLERLIVGGAVGGAVSRLEYAWRLFFVASVLFDGGIGPFLLVRWSHAHAAGRLRVDWRTVQRPIVAAAGLAAAVALALFTFAPLVVHVLYGRGAFAPTDVEAVTAVLRAYAFGFVCNMTSICMERLLLARGQNGAFLRLTLARVGSHLVSMKLLLPVAGIMAAPYGFTIGELLYVLLLIVVLHARGFQ